MVIIVSRTTAGAGLTLRAASESGNGVDDYEATIRPGESALGYTYEEWDTALGPQGERRIRVAEDGTLRSENEESDAPADGNA